MAHSYLLGGATAEMQVRICSPAEYRPDPAVVAAAARIAGETGGGVELASAPKEACDGADVLATDVWVSMGQDEQQADRLAALSSSGPDDSYCLDAPKLALAAPGCVVLHCLPAHRGTEITAEVLDGPASVIWDQAENRLHAQKALLTWLLEHAPHAKDAP
jgi:ornithine carbamoyltransferase